MSTLKPAAVRRSVSWLSACYLAALVLFAAWYLVPSLFRSWYFFPDEWVIVGEVMRFAHLDFRQHFVDMPGAPLMLLSALGWRLMYHGGSVLGMVPKAAGLEAFTFGHLPLLFGLVRAITLLSAMVSVVLVFLVASRLSNRAGAAVATFILIMSPTYSLYSSWIRVESMAMCLMLGSILALLHGLKSVKPAALEIRWILFSGVLAGLAAACRFHSITASLPVLLLLMLLTDREPPAYPQRLDIAWNIILGLGFLGSTALAIGIRSGLLPATRLGGGLVIDWPAAFEKLFPLAIAAGILSAGALCLRLLARKRPQLDRYAHPRILVLIAGSCLGCLIGAAPAFWNYRYVLRSISMYSSSYIDWDRAAWPFLKNLAWFIHYYMRLIAPDNLTLFLMLLGAVVIILRRDKFLIAILTGAMLFFVSKPINLRAAPHHFILWLPFYAIVAGYGVAQAYDALRRNLRNGNQIAAAALVTLFVALALSVTPGPVSALANTREDEKRIANIELASDWVHRNTEPDALVVIAYYCSNPDSFRTWLQWLEVPQPATSDRRHYPIWWGEQSGLAGSKGYLVATAKDLPVIKTRVDLISPGTGTDPWTDPRFERIQTFGADSHQVDIFRFNFAGAARLP